MRSYIALIRKDHDSDYGVDFPDFPGCISAGSTFEEARAMAEEALDFHIEGMLADGEVLPEPSRLEDVAANPENSDAALFLIEVEDPPSGRVQVNFTLAEGVLRKIDDWAVRQGRSRSSFFEKAALDALKRAESA